MIKYSIAGLNILFDGYTNEYFRNRLSEYLSTDQEAEVDIIIKCEISDNIVPPKGKAVANINQRNWLITDDGGYASYDYNPDLDLHLAKIVADKQWKNIHAQLYNVKKLNLDDTYGIYNMLGEVFRFAILKNDGIVIHSSSVNYNGNGIIFSAPCETGKSTHAALWKKYYPDATTIINDDSPAIRYIDGIPYVFGTPWSGKSNINCNQSASLKAIVFLEQSKTNSVERLDGAKAISYLINEIRQPVVKDLMLLSLEMADRLLKDIPSYLLRCNISKHAVDLIKNEIGV